MTGSRSATRDNAPLLSVVTPAYKERDNLNIFYQRLVAALDPLGIAWEWIVVDDHSPDETFTVVRALAERDSRVRGLRLSRNCGSHAAITCGLQQAAGACSAVLASDLQDPPEVIPQLLERWRAGVPVVWAARARREGETTSRVTTSRMYHAMMRRIIGNSVPAVGADFFLLDRRVMETLSRFPEQNVSLLALISWIGFEQQTLYYTKEARLHGRSGWTLEKKLKLAVDSITSFTYLPIRVMSYVGGGVALLGFLYAGFVLFYALHGNPVQGWASLMVVLLVVGGVQMMMMGVLGEYLWRALDESRRRPRYMIEDTAGIIAGVASAESAAARVQRV